jgi:hypothetical protein
LSIHLDEQGLVIINRRNDFDAVVTAAAGKNDGVGPLLGAHLRQSGAHARRRVTFYLHVNLHESSNS